MLPVPGIGLTYIPNCFPFFASDHVVKWSRPSNFFIFIPCFGLFGCQSGRSSNSSLSSREYSLLELEKWHIPDTLKYFQEIFRFSRNFIFFFQFSGIRSDTQFYNSTLYPIHEYLYLSCNYPADPRNITQKIVKNISSLLKVKQKMNHIIQELAIYTPPLIVNVTIRSSFARKTVWQKNFIFVNMIWFPFLFKI